MQKLPQRYVVVAAGEVSDDVRLESGSLPPLESAAPPQFEGPGDRWSPETLLVGSLAGCFVLTFRAVARASKLAWTSLRCEVHGTLERIDNRLQFSRFDIQARLTIPGGEDSQNAHRVIERAEHKCLISNSLKAPIYLTVDVEAGAAVPEAAHARC